MILALTCTLCLAGTGPLALPAEAHDAAATLSLASIPSDLQLSGPGTALGLAQQGLQEGRGEGDMGHGGNGAWMGTTMIVIMVAVMAVGVGAVMMMRASSRMAPSSGAAAAALPVLAPRGFSTPGG